MKVLNFFRIALCTVAVAFASSCVDPNQEPTINFPEATSYDLAIDQVLELSFKAEATWKLTTDKDWLKFVDPVLGTTETLDGPAGDQTIKITTANVTSIFDEETAVISIEMGGQSKTLFNITKTAVARWAKMFLCEYGEDPVEITEENPLVAEYNELGEIIVGINFQANFAWKVSTWPDWIDMQPFAGEANQTLSKTDNESFYVKESAYACAQTGNITITDMDGNNPFSFPVSYAGMPDNVIKVTNANGRELNLWSTTLSFSAEGFVVESNMLGDSETTESTSATVSVLAKDYKYAYVAVTCEEMYGMKVWKACPDWLTVTDDAKGTLTVSVQTNTGKAREAYICVVPVAKIPTDVEMDQWWYSEHESELENYAFAVKQDGAEVEGGIKVQWSSYSSALWGQVIDCVPFSNYTFEGDFAGLGLSEFGWNLPRDNTSVYELPANDQIAGPLVIAPVGFPQEWYPVAEKLYNAYGAFGMAGFYVDAPNFANALLYTNPYVGMGETCAISYSETALKAAPSGAVMILELYKDEAEYGGMMPSAALILVKK